MDIESTVNIQPNTQLGKEHLELTKKIYKVFRKPQGDSFIHYFMPNASWITHGNEEYIKTVGNYRFRWIFMLNWRKTTWNWI